MAMLARAAAMDLEHGRDYYWVAGHHQRYAASAAAAAGHDAARQAAMDVRDQDLAMSHQATVDLVPDTESTNSYNRF